jgi:hypothetical protein
MLEIRRSAPLEGRTVRPTLSDGSTVDRDLTDLLRGPVFERIAADDAAFRRVRAREGTVVWLGDVDLAPETLIWDGPTPADETARRPAGHCAAGGGSR